MARLRDLDLDVWPTFEKLNLGHNFWTKRDRALILHKSTSIPCDKTFLSIPKFLSSWPWPWLLIKLNLGHNFWTKRDRAFIFHMCIPFDKTFLLEPNFLPRDLDLDFWPTFEKKINLDNNFWTKTDRALILNMTLTFTYFWKNLNLLLRGGISPVRTDPDLVWSCFLLRHLVLYIYLLSLKGVRILQLPWQVILYQLLPYFILWEVKPR